MQIVLIGPWIADSEFDNLLTTKRYWALQSLNSSTFRQADLAEFVRLEIMQRVEAFDLEAVALDHELRRWGTSQLPGVPGTVAVVLDTNALLSHYEELGTFQWHEVLDIRTDQHLGLAIPLQVIRELDRHKMSSNNTVNRGTRNELRRDAGAARRFIEEGIPDANGRHWLHESDAERRADLSLMLIPNKVPGFPIPDPDTEIIDRARSLLPFATEVHFVSYDAAAVFQAQQIGMHSVKLTYS